MEFPIFASSTVTVCSHCVERGLLHVVTNGRGWRAAHSPIPHYDVVQRQRVSHIMPSVRMDECAKSVPAPTVVFMVRTTGRVHGTHCANSSPLFRRLNDHEDGSFGCPSNPWPRRGQRPRPILASQRPPPIVFDPSIASSSRVVRSMALTQGRWRLRDSTAAVPGSHPNLHCRPRLRSTVCRRGRAVTRSTCRRPLFGPLRNKASSHPRHSRRPTTL